MADNKICFNLEDHEASALAQFFARMNWSVIRKYAASDNDADTMHLALIKAKFSLTDAGFHARLAAPPPGKA